MSNLLKQPIRQKASPGKDPAYLAKVAQLPCAVCHHHGLRQESPTQVHHTIHDRYGTRRTPDREAIPLCCGHHQGDFDTSKVALHREPKLWRELYGPDTGYIEWTLERAGKVE